MYDYRNFFGNLLPFIKMMDKQNLETILGTQDNKFFLIFDTKNKVLVSASVRENGKGTFANTESLLSYIVENNLVHTGYTGVNNTLPIFNKEKKQ